MPAFNAEDTILESINSVINQTYENWELIVINDGSSDNTINVVQEIKDGRIKLITQKNKGVAEARNKGIDCSSGDYIAFLDSDDIWHHKKLELQLDFFNTNQVDLLHTDFYYFTNTINDKIYKKYIEPYNLELTDYEKLLVNDIIVTSSVMIHKNIINKLGYFDSTFHGVEDWDYWIRLSKNYKISKIDNCLTYYRENIRGISKNLDRQLSQEILIRKKHLTSIVPQKVRKLSEWQLLKKKMYYCFVNKNILRFFIVYLKMSLIFTFKLEKNILMQKFTS